MELYTTYSVKIKHYNHIFKDTVSVYRKAVDYLLCVCDDTWDKLSAIKGDLNRQRYVETLIHKTKYNLSPMYDFDNKFYKLPSYLRRGAINEAIGKYSSYNSNLTNWLNNPSGKKPSFPCAGYIFPTLYKDNMYKQIGEYKAAIKVYVRNTWDWLTVDLRKTDIDYIDKHCNGRKACTPTLQKRGKEWFLDFPFSEKVTLSNTDINKQVVVSVDLGINNAATISVLNSDGTILGRHFLKLSKEIDHLSCGINRIKKAQQQGNHKTPRLWAKVKGINHDISVKTAQFIIDTAIAYKADVIVFEHLETKGKLSGFKKQRIHLWRKKEVQSIVTNKAHRLGKRISHVCAWGTSKYAYDGSGIVSRGKESDLNSYSICTFSNGKIYNCDLSASYNIGARYFIREIIKSLDVNSRLDIEAKVPQCTKRSTCTLSTLISLNAVLASI